MVLLQVLINGLFLGGVYALISLGLTLIFGVIRVINFAHGEILMISMYASFFCFSVLGLNPYLSLIIVIPGMFLVGVLVDQVIIRPIRNAPSYMQIFATVGLSVVLINLALVFFSGDYRSINLAFAKQVVHMGDIGISLSRLIVFISAIAVAWLVWLFLDRTDMGKQIRAIAQDRDAARLMGINPNKIYMITFGIGSAMVGLAGGLIMPLYYVFPSVGAYFVLTAFVVVVLGGLGNMVGALLGGLIIGVIDSLSGYYLDPALKEMVYFLVFLGVLLFKPSGLMGMIGAEEMGLK
ncbi:MAG: branched-chain amino acid ABC transporter permease [Desulfarculaceae bacterium]|nr:branched-chain amino acid ABC transporter permease [Desulfarculaceae bacterium]MCF8046841.1 branched-chain amino acid ABC transporter permease [Desulfarculaceae bacterium]MCF8064306.1 branched-chain amino acid ABC transporter permease [Desulfarculaceae bacterium]MCF8096777.1 branched-chain amino acid ABC transporter permease [Desulfarculaceae bacterium]MCF8121430.1 branched-chain amino acid ABC transporter permease [Desulfarculaceae bacterium]